MADGNDFVLKMRTKSDGVSHQCDRSVALIPKLMDKSWVLISEMEKSCSG